MITIGIVAGAMKPYTKGHDYIIRLASKENDEVNVFVSIHDRVRRNEHPIHAIDMLKIWKEQIIDSLPLNVSVWFVNNPISSVYEFLDTSGGKNSYTIYGDNTDISKAFSVKSLAKYDSTRQMLDNNLLKTNPIKRSTNVDISATEMRQYIKDDNKEAFFDGLPDGLNKEKIWKSLSRPDN